MQSGLAGSFGTSLGAFFFLPPCEDLAVPVADAFELLLPLLADDLDTDPTEATSSDDLGIAIR